MLRVRLVIGSSEGQMILVLIITLEAVFINQSQCMRSFDIGDDFVELRDLSLGISKNIFFRKRL